MRSGHRRRSARTIDAPYRPRSQPSPLSVLSFHHATRERHSRSGPASPDLETALRTKILSYLDPPETQPVCDLAGNPILRPTPEAVQESLRFVEALPPLLRPPHIGAADDGEINFSWIGDGIVVDVGFRGDGHLHYFARVDSEAIKCGGEVPFTVPVLPPDLRAALIAVPR